MFNLNEMLWVTPKLSDLLWVDMAQKTAPFHQTPTGWDFGWGVSVNAKDMALAWWLANWMQRIWAIKVGGNIYKNLTKQEAQWWFQHAQEKWIPHEIVSIVKKIKK